MFYHGTLGPRISDVANGRLGGPLSRKALYGPHSIYKLLEIKFGICIQVHPSDNRNEQVVVGQNAALDQEPFEVDLVYVLVVPVIDGPEQYLQAVVVPTGQLLLQILLFPSHLQFFVYQP